MSIIDYINEKTLFNFLNEDNYYANNDWVVFAPTINELKIRANIYPNPSGRRKLKDALYIKNLLLTAGIIYDDAKAEVISLNKFFWPHPKLLPDSGILAIISKGLTKELSEERRNYPELTQNKFLQQKILNHPKAPNLNEAKALARQSNETLTKTATTSGLLTLDTLKFLTANPSILASEHHIAVQPVIQFVRHLFSLPSYGTLISDGRLMKQLTTQLGYNYINRADFNPKIWDPLTVNTHKITFYLPPSSQKRGRSFRPYIEEYMIKSQRQNSISQITEKLTNNANKPIKTGK